MLSTARTDRTNSPAFLSTSQDGQGGLVAVYGYIRAVCAVDIATGRYSFQLSTPARRVHRAEYALPSVARLYATSALFRFPYDARWMQ